MYSKDDIKLLEDNYSKIDEEIKKLILSNIDPKRGEIESVMNIILEYIKDKKRIIYGGTAHNELIKINSKDDAFYKENDYGDIDFYSPTPIKDITELADILYNEGYNNVFCREALHDETFGLTVSCHLYCEVTYVPKFIYDNFPTKKINGFRYVHPFLAMIDYLRMFTDPMFSSFRWIKGMKRMHLLQKYYEFPKIKRTTKFQSKISKDVLDTIFDIISEKNVILIDDYAHNYYVNKSGKTDYIEVTKYVAISFNFERDANNIYDEVLSEYNKIEIEEHAQFFQYTGRSITFKMGNEVILKLYDYNGLCLPYFNVEKMLPDNKTFVTNTQIKMATFPLVILCYLIETVYLFVYHSRDYMNNYEKITKLIDIRNEYLKENNKTIIDNTIFREFNTVCIGKTVTLQQKKRESKNVAFKYEPGKKSRKTKYTFANTSGNIITNKRKSVISCTT